MTPRLLRCHRQQKTQGPHALNGIVRRDSPGGVAYLGKLAGLADPETPGSRDSTAYTCWSAPTFISHHGMCLSAAVTYADALALAEGARRLKISMAAA